MSKIQGNIKVLSFARDVILSDLDKDHQELIDTNQAPDPAYAPNLLWQMSRVCLLDNYIVYYSYKELKINEQVSCTAYAIVGPNEEARDVFFEFSEQRLPALCEDVKNEMRLKFFYSLTNEMQKLIRYYNMILLTQIGVENDA